MSCKHGITRRGFLLGAGAGLAVGAPLGWLALDGWQRLHKKPFTGRSVEDPRAPVGMPGPYPGRVVEVRHPRAVLNKNILNARAVRAMMHRGMCSLTGADDPASAWRRFFEPSDVIGIKVNPVGRKENAPRGVKVVGSISSLPVLREVVRNLKEIGVPARNLIFFERYANEFRDAGYERELGNRLYDGIHWFAAAHAYDNSQLDIDGQPPSGNRDPHVVGYDPDIYATMGFCSNHHSPRDERRFHSHVSLVVSRMVNKIITIPCLKDHQSAGVTLALKNMSHGFNNNVARSHLSGIYRRGGQESGPNQCNTFIPHAVNQLPIKQKAVLHIMDGLIGVYEGGPGPWNRTWGTWRRQSLFFATDPVAMDHVGWDILDAKRALEGWLPVGRMGLVQGAPMTFLSPRLAALAAASPEAGALALAEHHNRPADREPFDRRQPEHVVLAGLMGLGTFESRLIDHRVHTLS